MKGQSNEAFAAGNVVPPRSVICSKAGDDKGVTFRIGYYSRKDGLGCVWLVNDAGEYEQTWDQSSLRDSFEIVSLSSETDLFGDNKTPLGPIQ